MKLTETAPTIDSYLEDIDSRAPETAQLVDLLSPEEQAKSDLFRSPRDRRRYILRHARIRELLARHLGCAPSQVPIVFDPSGKPRLVGHDIGFTMAHSHGLALYAIAPHMEVGCDVERINPALATNDVARLALSAAEIAVLSTGPPEQWLARFYLLWTVKEAAVKATGQGLGAPVDAVDASPAKCGGQFSLGDGWTGLSFAPLPQVQCAFVFREALNQWVGPADKVYEPSTSLNASRALRKLSMPAGTPQ